MKKKIISTWKRGKYILEQNKQVSSAVFILFSILIGGMLSTIGVAIFEPTYVYPSIKVFIVAYIIGGMLFTICLAAIALSLLVITIIKENPKILLSENCIVPFILLLIVLFLL